MVESHTLPGIAWRCLYGASMFNRFLPLAVCQYAAGLAGVKPFFKALTALSLLFALAGCGVSSQVTRDSGIEQQLLYHAMSRAAQALDVSPFLDVVATVEVHAPVPSDRQAYASGLVKTLLMARGMRIIDDAEKADVHLKVIAPVFGIDHAETLIGIPSITIPLVGSETPDLAFYQSIRDRGWAELEVYAFDEKDGRLIGKTDMASGFSKFNRYTVAFFVGYTRSDLGEGVSR